LKNFGSSTASEFGRFLRKTSFSSSSTSSRSRSTISSAYHHPNPSSASPPSPSDPSFLAIPRPPPFFYGGDAASRSTPSTTIPPEEGGPRIGVRFGRSGSIGSNGSGDGGGSEEGGERSWEEGGSEESLERAEIGFGERGRWEWAGFQSPQSPHATRTGFNLVRGGGSSPLLTALSISDASRDFAWPER